MSTVQSQIEKKFEIHVKEHPGELLQHINSAWKERRLCDFLIKVGSKEIPVHKIILSEGSDYFKAMFSHKMKEVESGVAVMEGVDPECMLICIEYIYTGKVSVPESKVQPLLQVASMLQLTRLCEVIGAFLETNLDPDSFFLARKIANTFNLQGLKDHCEKYSLENFKLIAVKEGFNELEKELVKFMLESDKNKASEAIKCKALVVWANFDTEKRTSAFEDAFLRMKVKKIPASYLRYLEENEPLVFNSTSCLRKLFRSGVDISEVKGKDVYLADHPFHNQASCNAIAVFDTNSKSIQAFKPEDKTWAKVHSLPHDIASKSFFFTTMIDENLFILANDKTNYKLNYTDPGAEWIQLPSRTATNTVVAVSLLGEVYAFHDSDRNSQTIEKLNMEQTCWSQMTKPFPCFRASVIAADGHIYTFGGVSDNNCGNVSKFDPDSKAWSNLPAMPTARYGAGSAELNGKIYVMGGAMAKAKAKTAQKTTECFNIESQSWTTLKSMILDHYQFNACTINGKIYAVGGFHSGNAIEEYDPSKDEWKTVDMMTGKAIHDKATVSMIA